MSQTRTFRIVLQITCQLLWLAGLVVGLSGMYLLLIYRNSGLFFCNIYNNLPPILAIVSAALLLVSGVAGCLVSMKKSSCLQAVFVYLLVMVFCLVSTAAALAYSNTGKVDADLAPFRGVFERYSGNSQDADSIAVDAIQEELQCCGVHGYRDWLSIPWFNHTGKPQFPHSCCNSTFHICNGTLDQTYFLYHKGCLVKLEEALIFILRVIISSSSLVALVLMIALVCVGQLMKDQPLQEYRILDRD